MLSMFLGFVTQAVPLSSALQTCMWKSAKFSLSGKPDDGERWMVTTVWEEP